VEVHADGLAHVGCAGAMQTERNSGFIQMGIEARRALECANVEPRRKAGNRICRAMPR
jgi:hypothetical protein